MSLSLLALVLSVVLGTGLQRLVYGRWQNSVLADLSAGLCALMLFLLVDTLSGRPVFSLFCTTICLGFLAIVCRAKMRVLRNEPLLFSDIPLVRQVILYPALYLPFLPVRRLLLLGGLLLVLGGGLFFLETPEEGFPVLFLVLTVLFLLSAFFPLNRPLLYAFLVRRHLQFGREDTRWFGPLGAAVLHALWFLRWRHMTGQGVPDVAGYPSRCVWRKDILDAFAERAGERDPASVDHVDQVVRDDQASGTLSDTARTRVISPLPHIVLIQEESFSDPRKYLPDLPVSILSHLDLFGSEGLLSELHVAAFGAYTMRTEYAILTGLRESDLLCDALHPYWRASSRRSTWSAAQFLLGLGYETCVIHPYASGFFYRDLALPGMGFRKLFFEDDLWREFPETERFGPYISDMTIARFLEERLSRADRPVFAFVITMENHGPWGEGRLTREETGVSGPYDPEVLRYLTHIANADRMLAHLHRTFRESSRPVLFGLYGDHLPALPSMIPDDAQDTPCLLWSSGHSFPEERKEALPDTGGIIPSEFLGRLLELGLDHD